MSIVKITKLKNFGIFYDFTWGSELPDFKKFNLIYGWNRSGKTTLSRSFSACERKSTIFKHYPINGEFEIRTDYSLNVKSYEVENCNLPIKVFNKDFIDDNIFFESSDPCNPIVYISEEDIESKKKLEVLKNEKQPKLNKNLEVDKENKNAKENLRNNFLTSIGREIANILFDKNYNKIKVEKRIEEIGVDNFVDKILSDEDEKKFRELSRIEAKQKQDYFLEYQIDFLFGAKSITSFDDIFLSIKQLLEKKVISDTIERLKNDQDLNNWVKQGFDLHKVKNEKEKCLFCQKLLDNNFLNSLSKHYSEDYETLQGNITEFIVELKKLRKESILIKNDDLYPDLKSDYRKEAKILNTIIDESNKWIDEVIKKLQEKFRNPLSIISLPIEPSNFKTNYNNSVDELTKIIQKHNEKVDNHEEEVKTAKEKLELHLIAESVIEQDYKKIEKDLKDAETKELEAKEATDKNNDEIIKLEQQTSNIGQAVEKINKHLKEFFGRDEIKLELDNGENGYYIKRDGQFADNLSEGEKTAIAFSYFIVKVQEKDFKIKDGIIFIDDPISSFDSNFIYHCFSLIKNNFKNVGQLFISTHNFTLFNLIKDWFVNKKKNKEVCGFYMIENFLENEKRKARIKLLEETLKNFKSEYHFLFSLLYKFSQNPNPEYADFYNIGNIARRFLEIFTNFKIPTTGDLASKIDALEINNEKISEIEIGKVYKLIQEFSHGSEPISTIEHIDKSESQEAIKILLEIVKVADPKHFELLLKNLPSSTIELSRTMEVM